MAGTGGPPFDPTQPPLGDEEAMQAWWEQLDQQEREDPQHLERAPAEGQGAEPPPPVASAPRAQPSTAARRGLFAGLSREEFARAFVLGEVLGPPRSRRGRR